MILPAALTLALGLTVAWLVTPSTTDRRHLSPGPLARLMRRARWAWFGPMLAIAGWPVLLSRRYGVGPIHGFASPIDRITPLSRGELLRFKGNPVHPEPILIVHALVSRPQILDLTPERSFVRALLDAGFDVFLLDWGEAEPEHARDGLLEHARLLLEAEQEVLACTGAQRLHLIGYCTGGTLALARAGAWRHDHVGSITTLAAPVDMAARGGMKRIVGRWWFTPVLALDHTSRVPAAAVREAFHALRPESLRAALARMRNHDEAFARTFAALGSWAWDQRPMPGALFYDLMDVFRTNALVEGTLFLGEQRVDLTAIKVPLFAAIAERDHIVPPGSSRYDPLGAAGEVIECPSGHVSMISGSTGRQILFPALIDWVSAHQARTTTPRPRAGARKNAGAVSRGRPPGSGATARPRAGDARRNS